MKTNGKNERVKRDYFEYLREAKRYSEASVDAVAKAIDRFETYTGHRDFAQFRIELAIGFKAHLASETSIRNSRPLSLSTRRQTLTALRELHIWLADRQGYRSRIRYADAEYFNLPLKEEAMARATRDREGPTLDQIRHVLNQMPRQGDIARRDRALVAFAILTGLRDDALASLRLKHIDLLRDEVWQDARLVRTKRSKSMTTWFFPVGDDIRAIFAEWIEYLLRERQWGLDDPLFPATAVARGASGGFEAVGLARRGWSNANRVRAIFRSAFEAANLPYHNPHSFRKTLARLGLELTRGDHEALKAWSQNLGHESMLTTLTSYGAVPAERQRVILTNLGQRPTGPAVELDPEVQRLLAQAARKMAGIA
jgi:integrase